MFQSLEFHGNNFLMIENWINLIWSWTKGNGCYLMPFAGIVGDGSENTPNIRIRIVKRLRSETGSNRNNAIFSTQNWCWILLLLVRRISVGSRGSSISAGFVFFHRHCCTVSQSRRERERIRGNWKP